MAHEYASTFPVSCLDHLATEMASKLLYKRMGMNMKAIIKVTYEKAKYSTKERRMRVSSKSGNNSTSSVSILSTYVLAEQCYPVNRVRSKSLSGQGIYRLAYLFHGILWF